MSNPSKKDLAGLFKDEGGGIGLDDESSSILIANLDATTTPMCIGDPFDADEEETDDFRIIQFILDESSSMGDVQGDVRDCFNEIVLPGLLGGAADQVGAIRFSGIKFGTRVRALWDPGFKKLTDVMPELTTRNYRANGATALHKAVLDGITAATSHALQIADRTGTHPEVVIAVLSDGANNQAPMSASDVRKVTDKLSGELFTLVFIGFETWERVDFKQIASELGFRDILESKAKSGESPADQQRRFRNVMKVFSDKLVSRASSSRVGSSTGAGSTGFWE